MTNKSKRSATAQAKKQKKLENAAASVDGPNPTLKPWFTTAQLAAIMCIAVGSSKILEFYKALREGSENPEICMSYLIDEETCKNSSFGSLVLLKYYSGVSLTAIVASLAYILWDTEHLLTKFITCIFATPLTTTGFASVLSDGIIKPARIWHLIMMSGVLMMTCVPSTPDHFPFLNQKSWTLGTLQSVCLVSLAVLSLADISRVFSGDDSGMQNALLDVDTPLPIAARSVLYFWIVDKLSMALLFAFAVVHLPARTQRMFLLAVSLLKFGEYFIQLPKMTETLASGSTVEHSTMVSAIFAGIACFV